MTREYKFCPQCGSRMQNKRIEGIDRKVCADQRCGFVFWNNPVPVVGIVVETTDGVLLAHNRSWPEGMFSIVTGFLEPGESPENAAIREVKEELDLTVHEITFLGNFPFARLNQLMIGFHARATGQVSLNEELDSFKFVRKEQLLGWTTRNRFEIEEWLINLRVEV
jgi:NAD+ diphosphatase